MWGFLITNKVFWPKQKCQIFKEKIKTKSSYITWLNAYFIKTLFVRIKCALQILFRYVYWSNKIVIKNVK